MATTAAYGKRLTVTALCVLFLTGLGWAMINLLGHGEHVQSAVPFLFASALAACAALAWWRASLAVCCAGLVYVTEIIVYFNLFDSSLMWTGIEYGVPLLLVLSFAFLASKQRVGFLFRSPKTWLGRFGRIGFGVLVLFALLPLLEAAGFLVNEIFDSGSMHQETFAVCIIGATVLLLIMRRFWIAIGFICLPAIDRIAGYFQ